MKKLLIPVLLFLVAGCGKDDKETDYRITYIVENESATQLGVVKGNTGEVMNVDAGTTETISTVTMKGPSDNKQDLEDVYDDGDDFIEPVGFSYVFEMTVKGQKISENIWRRKYWSFSSTNFTWTYTLTVTDELLKEHMPKPEEPEE